MTIASDVLIRLLADRTETIERTLDEDEYFCNEDIDGLYRAALRYVQSIEDKLKHRCRVLKSKLDQCREENARQSKRNKEEFESSIERVEHLFTRGQQQEGSRGQPTRVFRHLYLLFVALETFHQYEEQFRQRTTLIAQLPKLRMQDIGINEYFSFDQQLDTPEKKNRTLKGAMDEKHPNQSLDLGIKLSQEVVPEESIPNRSNTAPVPCPRHETAGKPGKGDGLTLRYGNPWLQR